MSARESESAGRAKQILRGQAAELQEILDLADVLAEESAFGYARRILARAYKDPTVYQRPALRLRLAQKHALSTYKDPDLPTSARLERALQILWEVEDLATTTDQETLGQAGAIYKRKWELDGQKQDLERSLGYYLRGYEQGAASDRGYTGINAAFVLDLLADQEMAEARPPGTAFEVTPSRREQANRIREDLVARLPDLSPSTEQESREKAWWLWRTLAEAYFGLGRYQEALPWLKKAMALPDVPDWQRESAARQLATIARLREESSGVGVALAGSPAEEVLLAFLGNDETGVRTAFIGKVGLALSGGGFRASLFHLGVLARLAELDVLRNVEVLSCVSGGSIIGAHFYLEVRRLLQEKTDDEITRQDYIEIVQRMERDFLAGVQRDIRTRVAAEFRTNFYMLFRRNLSRTQRAGELFEEEIFSRVKDGEGHRPRWLDQLVVQPPAAPADFTPKYHNWRRRAKVPILILNATTLNTGHNWQFTTSWMGEPPGSIDTEIDGHYRLRRLYYGQAPERLRNIRLGHAVAASACVPGISDPLNLPGLYPETTVSLVDGGVHDNQGVAGLLEQECTVLLVSDASGQMQTQNHPSNGVLGVPLRANRILMARVREAQYHGLRARQRSSLLRGLMFVHLKKDLGGDPVDWVGCEDPYDPSDEIGSNERRGPLTCYGIRKDVQQLVAEIRTDLDAFSEVEACALMVSGYRITEYEFAQSMKGFPRAEGDRCPWRFLAIESPMKQIVGAEAAHRELKRLLAAGSSRFFKVWQLSLPLRWVAPLLPFAAAAGVIGLAWYLSSKPMPLIQRVVSGAAWFVAYLMLKPTLFRVFRNRKAFSQIGIDVGMFLVGGPLARIQLHFLDPLYLRWGRIDRVMRRSSLPAAPPPVGAHGGSAGRRSPSTSQG